MKQFSNSRNKALIGKEVLVPGKYGKDITCVVTKAEEDILYVKDTVGNKYEFGIDEIIMKVFQTVEEAKNYGKDFSKRQSELVLIDGKKTLLCGTDLVYEDDLWGDMYEALKVMLEICHVNEDDCDGAVTDKASDLRDNVIGWIEEECGVQIVTVYDEY